MADEWRPRLLAEGFEALEGPVVDDEGNLYFGDLKAGGVHRLRPDGGVDVVVPERRNVGGICRHAAGGLVVSGADLRHIHGEATRVLLTVADLPATAGGSAVGFNDIAADAAGQVLAGVLRRDAKGPVPGQLVGVTGPGQCTVIHDDIHPNGLAFSPDGSRMYAADTYRRRVVVFAVSSSGRPEPAAVWSTDAVPGLPDGVAADDGGHVWVAFYRGGCVARFTADGALAAVVEMPVAKPLSLCFGGPDRSDLYVVTGRSQPGAADSGGVYVIPAGARGVPVGVARI